MFREYQDARIQRNLKIVKIFSIIALILWAICTVAYLTSKWYPFELMKAHPNQISSSYITLFWGGEDIWMRMLTEKGGSNYDLWSEEISCDSIYCEGYLLLVLLIYSFSKITVQKTVLSKEPNEDTGDYMDERNLLPTAKVRTKQYAQKRSVESKLNNDFANTLVCVVLSMIPVAIFISLLFAVMIASLAGTIGDIAGGVRIASSHLGFMFLSHIFLIISSGFLIQNCVLIKREWKRSPPQFLLEEQQKAAEERQKAEAEARKQKAEQDAAACKALLEECGMQFFIEYYPQIKRLPLRDVIVSDHYFPEREVRLTAAKKIVDSGLSECALRYIIENYGDIFSSETIDRAKSILDEIENEKKEK